MKRIAREKKTIEVMLTMFCRHHHGDALCNDCKALLEYALKKIDKCPLTKNKPVCSACKIHCYHADRRSDIKTVMRYAGPRMIYTHPVLAVQYYLVKVLHPARKH